MTNRTLAAKASDNRDEWDLAAEKAKEAAASVGEMVNHAGAAVGAMASQAACDASKKADKLAANAGASIQGLGERMSKNSPDGVFGAASQGVARTVRESGDYLEKAKFSGMTEDISKLIQQNPIPAVLMALGLGWFVGRRLGN